jgi:hypothetical protein
MSRKIVKIAAQPWIAPSLYSYNGDMHAGHPINKWQVSVGKLKLPPRIQKPVEEKKDILIPVDPIYKKTTKDHKSKISVPVGTLSNRTQETNQTETTKMLCKEGKA